LKQELEGIPRLYY